MFSDDKTTHSEGEYMVGSGDMEDLFILLISPAMS